MQKTKFRRSWSPISKIRAIAYEYTIIRLLSFHVSMLFTSVIGQFAELLKPEPVRPLRDSKPPLIMEGANLTQPKVTLIMPFHNTGEYLDAAIKSALASKGVALELILVDDGSTDGTGEIAELASKESPNVKVIKQRINRGAYFSRNLALLEANGEYIAFLDSDDIQDQHRLAKQISALEDYSAEVSLCNHSRWDVTLQERLTKPSPFIISMVFRRSLIDEVGFFHCVRWGADREFLKRVEEIKGKTAIVNVAEDLISARLRPGSLTTSPSSSFFSSLGTGRSIRVLPSRDRLIYRGEYSSLHRRARSKSELFQDFPLESRNLVSVGKSHESDVLKRDNVLVLVINSSKKQLEPRTSKHPKAANFLKANFEAHLALLQIGEQSLNLEKYGNRQFGHIILVNAESDIEPNLVRKLLTQALDLSMGEALVADSGYENGFTPSPFNKYINLLKPSVYKVIWDDKAQIVIGRLGD